MSVVVVGSVNRDIVVRVVRIPAAGETLLASGITRSGGGKGANQAVAAALAGGAATAFVGAIGDDADGAALRDALAGDGIDVSGLETVDGPSGVALISVADDGENAIVVVAGANAARDRLSDAQRALVAAADVLVTQLEIPIALVLDAARSRPAGSLHVLNAAPSAPLADARDELLATVDLLVVNEHELRDASGIDRIDHAVDAVSGRVPALVVTLGSDGCLVAMGSERIRVPAVPAHAVDTTGAGDTFCGVLAASLSLASEEELGLDRLVAAARAGSAAAAIAVSRPGAQEAVPTTAEVAALLASAG